MTGIELVAALVSSLAWPLVVVVIVVLFRQPLTALPSLLRKLKYKELEIEFAAEVKELQGEAAGTLPALPPGAATAIAGEAGVMQLAAVSPRAAVVEAWIQVETAARRALDRQPVAVSGAASSISGRSLTGLHLTRALLKAELLDRASSSLMDRLRMLRNQAVHADDFTVDEASAREYAELALALARRLESGPLTEQDPNS